MIIKTIGKKLLQLIPVMVIITVSMPIIGMGINESEKIIGYKAIPVPVVGTGSMYPSFYWAKSEGGPEDETETVIQEYRSTPHLYRRFPGFTINGRTFFRRTIQRGDIVAFKNQVTTKILQEDGKDARSGFVKRVIGIPGDTIELRDGFVYRNGDLLSEPYTATARSSYGGTTLADCTKITIPPGKYFVMGDNRKISSDSRYELGLVDDLDIEYLLPLAEQKIYQSLWRKTEGDALLLGQPTLSTKEFLSLINKMRSAAKLSPLTLKATLSKSANARGAHLLENKDTSYTMQQAISSSGYANIILGEFVTYGHYTAAELVENLLYNSGTSKQILSPDFSDIGVAEVEENIAGCPTQIIVGHLGGYIPASYEPGVVRSWHALVDNLSSALSSWEKAVDYNTINQAKLAELLTILRRRLALAKEIAAAMDNKIWLSSDQTTRIKNDVDDASAAEDLITQLNKS